MGHHNIPTKIWQQLKQLLLPTINHTTNKPNEENRYKASLKVQAIKKWNYQIEHFELSGMFDGDVYPYQTIHFMIQSRLKAQQDMALLPFTNGHPFNEIYLYKVNHSRYLTVYDSIELWQDAVVVGLY